MGVGEGLGTRMKQRKALAFDSCGERKLDDRI